MLGRVGQTYLLRRHTFLFYTLLVTLAVGPALNGLRSGAKILEAFLAVTLFAAILPFESGANRRLLIALLVVAGVVRAVGSAEPPWIVATGSVALAVVGLLAAARALRFAFRGGRVRAEQLYAALSAYLLAGVFLGVLYAALERRWPGSFALPSGTEAAGFPVVTAIYFSFVTLATLGYGDIVPRGEVARGLVIAEAVVGQLYLAVMVARLISLNAQEEAPKETS